MKNINSRLMLLVFVLLLISTYTYGYIESITDFAGKSSPIPLSWNETNQTVINITIPFYAAVTNFTVYIDSNQTSPTGINLFRNDTGEDAGFNNSVLAGDAAVLGDFQDLVNLSDWFNYGCAENRDGEINFTIKSLPEYSVNWSYTFAQYCNPGAFNITTFIVNQTNDVQHLLDTNLTDSGCNRITVPLNNSLLHTDNTYKLRMVMTLHSQAGISGGSCDGVGFGGSSKGGVNNYFQYYKFFSGAINVSLDVYAASNPTPLFSGVLDFYNNVNLTFDKSVMNDLYRENCTCDLCTIQGDNCFTPLRLDANTTNATSMTIVNISYEYGIDNCNQLHGNMTNATAFNISFYEENNLTSINADIAGTIEYMGNNFTFNYTDISSLDFCIYPNWFNTSIDAYMQYEQTDGYGVEERYYLDNTQITNTTQEIYLYNFIGTADLDEMTAYLYNYYYSPYPEVVMKMLRYYPTENIWRTVQVDKSDNFGKGLFQIYQRNVDYKFLFEIDGEILKASDPLKFECGTAACEQEFVLGRTTEADNYEGMSYYSSYNNESGIYSFTWSDSNNLVQSVRLIVTSEGPRKSTTICDTTVASAAGTINCNISAYSGTIFARAIRSASPEDDFFSETIDKVTKALRDILDDHGYVDDGILFAWIIEVGLVAFGAAIGSPIMVVIASLVGLVFIFIAGITSIINLALVFGIAMVGIITAYMVRK